MKKIAAVALAVVLMIGAAEHYGLSDIPRYVMAETVEYAEVVTPSSAEEIVEEEKEEMTEETIGETTDSIEENSNEEFECQIEKVIILDAEGDERITEENPLQIGNPAIFRFYYECSPEMKRQLESGKDISMILEIPQEVLSLTNTYDGDNPMEFSLYAQDYTGDGDEWFADILILVNQDEMLTDSYIEIEFQNNSGEKVFCKLYTSVSHDFTSRIMTKNSNDMKRPDYVPEDALYNEENGHWYKFYAEGGLWNDVVSECQQSKGYLLTITSEEEKDFVGNILTDHFGSGNSQGAIWLGLFYQDGWKWVTGEAFEYSNWNAGEPNGNGNEIYGIVNKNQYWNDGNSGFYYYICEWDNESLDSFLIKDADEEILELTKKYTSGEISKLVSMIHEADISIQEKYRRLNELFNYFGILEPQEGVEFLLDSTKERYAYNILTNDNIFTAYQYEEFLNSGSADAIAARAALFLSGLVLNNEISDYISWDTATGHLPGVKKYKTMLLSFMDASVEKWELQKNALEAKKFIKNYSEIMEIADGYDHVLTMIMNAETSEDITQAMNYFQNNIVLLPGEKICYQYKDTSFCKQLGVGLDIIEVIDFTMEDISAFFSLSARLDAYEKYQSLLEEIRVSEELPWELRAAAGFVIMDFEQEYLQPLLKLCKDVFEFTYDQVSGELDISKSISVGQLSFDISDKLLLLSLSSYVSNLFADAGELAENSQYVEGYGYLTKFVNQKLIASERKFVLSPTVENAWTFYNNYNLLYDLRMEGEKAYAKLSDVGGLFYATYQLCMGQAVFQANMDVANSNIKLLEEKCVFGVSDNVLNVVDKKYNKKVIISCPVDVEISDKNGVKIVDLKDGIESDVTNEFGRFICKYISYTQDYSKVLYIDDDTVEIKIKGNKNGLMDCSIYQQGDEGVIHSIMNYPITQESTIDLSVDSALMFVDNTNGDNKNVVFNQSNMDQTVKAESISGVPDHLTLYTKDEYQLMPVVLPLDCSNKRVFWWSSDTNILDINDGVVKAKEAGEADIVITSEDTQVSRTITVKVIKAVTNTDQPENRPGDSSAGGKGGSGGGGSGISRKKGDAIKTLTTSDVNLDAGTWEQDGADWRLRKTDGTYARNQWAWLNGVWYVFGNDSKMVTGMCRVNNVQYYFNSDGSMASGWMKPADLWYYFDIVTGGMKRGWIHVEGKWYYLKEDGSLLISSTTPDGYMVNSSGEWTQ